MPLEVDARTARAWASWLRLARLQVGFAASAGRVSGPLAEPGAVTRLRAALLREILELPAGEHRALLRVPDDAEFAAFAHFHRAAAVWLDELAARGVITATRGEAARTFAAMLLHHAGVAADHRCPPPAAAEPPPPAPPVVPPQPVPGLVIDLSWQAEHSR